MKKIKKQNGLGTLEILIIIVAIAFIIVSLTHSYEAAGQTHDTYIKPEYVGYCEEIGARYHLSPELLEALIETESSGDPRAENNGCVGLCQVSETYHAKRAAGLGVTDLYDPYGNILVAADYIISLYEEYGDDTALVLMKYNGSSDAVTRAYGGDFTKYANAIINRAQELERAHGKQNY